VPSLVYIIALAFLFLSGEGLSEVQTERWVNIGPAPIVLPDNTFSGRIADIAVDPSDSRHWLIGAATGGVWETHDAGSHWLPKTDDQSSLAMGSIAFAPSDPKILYAGTGEAIFSIEAYGGAGLLKSTNGGATWDLLAASIFAHTAFSDIKVDPANPDVLIAATAFVSATENGHNPSSNGLKSGIFKSADGGLTWSQKLEHEASDLEVGPEDFNHQYAGLGSIGVTSGSGVYRSFDAGDTWRAVTGPWTANPAGIGRVELAVAPSNQNIIYVSIVDGFNGVGNDGGLLGIWRTENAWEATPVWHAIPSDGEVFSSAQTWSRNHEIIVDPTDPDVFYLGGVHLWKFNGSSWANVTRNLHADQQSMAWAGDRLIVANDGGLFSSTDQGLTWTSHNMGLSITQFYFGSIHPNNADFAIGGSQDNGTEKWTGSQSWEWIFTGDGSQSAISSAKPDTDWAISQERLEIFRTTDGGATFTSARSGLNPRGAPFAALFEKCPANDDILIAGTDLLWKTSNFFSAPGVLGCPDCPSGPSWTANGPEVNTHITALAFAESDRSCDTYAFGTTDGKLRLTTTGGRTWVNITTDRIPQRNLTDLAFHPTNANVLYVTISQFNDDINIPGQLFKTENALSNTPLWMNITPPVDMPHNTVVLDRTDPNIVFVGTDQGIWRSPNGGESWVRMGAETGMPNVPVYDLQTNGKRLFAFTYGRGAFMLTSIEQPNQAPVAHIETEPVAGSVPLLVRFNGSTSVDPDGSIVSYVWDFGDGSSGIGAAVDHIYSASAIFNAALTVTDNSGAMGSATIAITVDPAPPTPKSGGGGCALSDGGNPDYSLTVFFGSILLSLYYKMKKRVRLPLCDA
jgi:photosystem II stability/assembly factor-like uncharacterized protein